jgi:hypothetical protein
MQHIEDLSKKRKDFILNLNKNTGALLVTEKFDGMKSKFYITPSNVFLQTRSKKIFKSPNNLREDIYYLKDIKKGYENAIKHFKPFYLRNMTLKEHFKNNKNLLIVEGEFLPSYHWNIIDYSNRNYGLKSDSALILYDNSLIMQGLYGVQNSLFDVKYNGLNLELNILQKYLSNSITKQDLIKELHKANHNNQNDIEGYVVEIWAAKDLNKPNSFPREQKFSFKVVDKDNFTKRKINDWALIEKMKFARKLESKKDAYRELNLIEKELNNYSFFSKKKQRDSYLELQLSLDILDGKIIY